MSTNEWAKPSLPSLAKHVADLLGLDTKAKATAAPWTPASGTPLAIAVYRSDRKSMAALAVLEFGLAAALGASLSRIPAGVAAEAVRARKLPENVVDNLREVFNISASLLTAKDHPHVVFDQLYVVPPNPPQEVLTLLMKPAWRLDAEVEIQNYGAGKFSFRLAAPEPK